MKHHWKLKTFFILFPHRLFGLVFTSTEGYSWTCRAYTAWSQKREWYAAFASFRGFFLFCFKSLILEGDVISWPQLPKGLKISFKTPASIWKQSTYFSVSLYGLGEWPFTRMALIGRVKRWTPEVSKYTHTLQTCFTQTLSLETTRGASNFGAGKCNDGARSAYWTTPLCFVRTVQQCN